VESNPLPAAIEYYFFPEGYSEANKRRLKELFAPQICELQEELLLELQRHKEMKSDVSSLRETPVYEDGKQLYLLVGLVESGSFAAIIGPRDFFEAKFGFPDSARNSGITPEPGVYPPKKSS
jgi:hypothetical protein